MAVDRWYKIWSLWTVREHLLAVISQSVWGSLLQPPEESQIRLFWETFTKRNIAGVDGEVQRRHWGEEAVAILLPPSPIARKPSAKTTQPKARSLFLKKERVIQRMEARTLKVKLRAQSAELGTREDYPQALKSRNSTCSLPRCIPDVLWTAAPLFTSCFSPPVSVLPLCISRGTIIGPISCPWVERICN